MSKIKNINKALHSKRNSRRKALHSTVEKNLVDDQILFKFNFNLDSENRERYGVVAVTREYIFRAIEAPDGEEKSPAVVERFKIADHTEFVARRNVGSVSLEALCNGGMP